VLVVFHQDKHNSDTNFIQFIKIGSACLLKTNGRVSYKLLKLKAREIENSSCNNVLVVSGAIALGMTQEKERRSKEELSLIELQGYAGIGQIYLMELYKRVFTKRVSQLLLTEKQLSEGNSIKNLLLENIAKNRITLINYNDCIDFEGLKKNNDTLAAEIMLICGGKRLIILGRDYSGFKDSQGELISRVSEINDSLYEHCNGKSKQGNGGFKTKLDAAKILLEKDLEMIVSNINYNLEEIIAGRVKMTLFKREL